MSRVLLRILAGAVLFLGVACGSGAGAGGSGGSGGSGGQVASGVWDEASWDLETWQ